MYLFEVMPEGFKRWLSCSRLGLQSKHQNGIRVTRQDNYARNKQCPHWKRIMKMVCWSDNVILYIYNLYIYNNCEKEEQILGEAEFLISSLALLHTDTEINKTRIGCPEINYLSYSQLVFPQNGSRKFSGEKHCFWPLVPGHLDLYMQNNKVGLLPVVIHKSNSEWNKDLNVRAKTIEPSEGLGNFLTLENMKNKWKTRYSAKINKFCASKTALKKVKIQLGSGSPCL